MFCHDSNSRDGKKMVKAPTTIDYSVSKKNRQLQFSLKGKGRGGEEADKSRCIYLLFYPRHLQNFLVDFSFTAKYQKAECHLSSTWFIKHLETYKDVRENQIHHFFFKNKKKDVIVFFNSFFFSFYLWFYSLKWKSASNQHQERKNTDIHWIQPPPHSPSIQQGIMVCG